MSVHLSALLCTNSKINLHLTWWRDEDQGRTHSMFWVRALQNLKVKSKSPPQLEKQPSWIGNPHTDPDCLLWGFYSSKCGTCWVFASMEIFTLSVLTSGINVKYRELDETKNSPHIWEAENITALIGLHYHAEELTHISTWLRLDYCCCLEYLWQIQLRR